MAHHTTKTCWRSKTELQTGRNIGEMNIPWRFTYFPLVCAKSRTQNQSIWSPKCSCNLWKCSSTKTFCQLLSYSLCRFLHPLYLPVKLELFLTSVCDQCSLFSEDQISHVYKTVGNYVLTFKELHGCVIFMFPLNMKLNVNNEEGQHLTIKVEFKGKRCVI